MILTKQELEALAIEAGNQAKLARIAGFTPHYMNNLIRGYYPITKKGSDLIILRIKYWREEKAIQDVPTEN